MRKLSERALLLNKGAFFITLTKKLYENKEWRLLADINHQMSWGETTIHIYQKISERKVEPFGLVDNTNSSV